MSDTKPIRILMIHGHGESSQKFRCKTRALTSHLTSSLNQKVEYTFLDAPHDTEPCTPDLRVWGLGEFQHDKIRGLEKSVKYTLNEIAAKGPFDGVIGFSTGACMSVIMGSLLEDEHKNQVRAADAKTNTTPGSSLNSNSNCPGPWRGSVFNIPLLPSPTKGHPPFKFIVAYSGFMLGNPIYADLYAQNLQTPIMHFSAELDHIVPPELTEALHGRCKDTQLHSFYGTHCVPRSRESFEAVAGFIKERCEMAGYEDEGAVSVNDSGDNSGDDTSQSSWDELN